MLSPFFSLLKNNETAYLGYRILTTVFGSEDPCSYDTRMKLVCTTKITRNACTLHACKKFRIMACILSWESVCLNVVQLYGCMAMWYIYI